MSAQRLIARWAVVAGTAALLGFTGVPAASAASPWWHLGSGTRPTNIDTSAAKSEVQKISAEAGTAFELNVNGTSVGIFESEPDSFGSFTPATAENVQTALEAVYGAGNVLVSGGPAGSAALTVTSISEDEDREVAPIAVGIAIGGNVEAKVTTRGSADGVLVVTASNLGDASVNGEAEAVSIADNLPDGFTASSIEGFAGNKSVSPGPVGCELATLTCTFASNLPAYDSIEIRISVLAKTGTPTGELNEVSVTGGEAPAATIKRPIVIDSSPTGFGIEDYELTPEEEGGSIATQAGSHPFQLTTTLALNQTADAKSAGLPKDMTFKWPPGLIGNPTPFSRCTLGQFLKFKGDEFVNACPAQSAVGVALVTINEPAGNLGTPGPDPIAIPIFNLEPARGEPARFGFLAPGTPVVIDTSVRSGQDYGIDVHTNNISQTAALLKAEVTVWGVPGDPRHDGSRGNGCVRDSVEKEHLPCEALEEQNPPAFLSLPTSCTRSPLSSTAEGDSWADPDVAVVPSEQATITTLDGCNRLPFSPSLQITPERSSASTPTGLTVDVHNPQQASLSAAGLAEADVKDIGVLLPEGLAINAAGANGLEACSEQQVGFTGVDSSGEETFSTSTPQSSGFCPDAAKIGTAKITTPVLPNPLEGSVYLAAQDANPFGSLVAMYIVAEDPVSGVLIKLAGQAHLSSSGQIEATFESTPQAPFEDAEVKFFGGERASLSTPTLCGHYTASASFSSWAAGPRVPASSGFNVGQGADAGPCTNPRPFTPSLAAGSTNIQAAAFSPLSVSVSRQDGEEELHTITVHTPPGLSGILSGVKLCPEPQADLGTCGPESLVGETTVSAGVGGDPVYVKGGRVYLTGGYEGAPFGLSIATPAKAGPYDLAKGTPCDCIVVRAKVEVDPHTAALSASTDSSGPYAIPTTLDGIPLEIKHVNATIDRERFTFNPTNCAPLSIAASIASTEGALSPTGVSFQVANCATLKFAPKFSVSTSAKTSKANGASLVTKLTYPAGAQGAQADIARVKVDLPKQLPSRLSTLQKACLAVVFEANPANCPAASIVGHAKVTTPLLPVPLSGPAYFVSHGGEAFPSLTMVLQGYGVTIDLVGATLIRKGITSTTFKTVPDVPFNTFELTLPEGKFSALTAFGNLCKSKLGMPTLFVAQNGAEIHQTTKIATTGCKKAKKVKKHKKKAKGKKD